MALSRPASFWAFPLVPSSAALTPVTIGGGATFPFSDVVALGPAQRGGFGAALVGLLALAGIIGFALGRGRRSDPVSTVPRG